MIKKKGGFLETIYTKTHNFLQKRLFILNIKYLLYKLKKFRKSCMAKVGAKIMTKIRLGINIDHIATLRNARQGRYPQVLEAMKIVAQASDFVTIHLRADRRHITDSDVHDINKFSQTFETSSRRGNMWLNWLKLNWLKLQWSKICSRGFQQILSWVLIKRLVRIINKNKICKKAICWHEKLLQSCQINQVCQNKRSNFPINFEMGMADEIVDICLQIKPKDACIVPETREEVTTESGLDIENAAVVEKLNKFVPKLKQSGIRVSLFVDANANTLNAIKSLSDNSRPQAIEIHTGSFCDALESFVYKYYSDFNYNSFNKIKLKTILAIVKSFRKIYLFILQPKSLIFATNIELFANNLTKKHISKHDFATILQKLNNIESFAKQAQNMALSVHAGHGLTYLSTYFIKQIKPISEISIGHFVVSQAVFEGLQVVIDKINCILKL